LPDVTEFKPFFRLLAQRDAIAPLRPAIARQVQLLVKNQVKFFQSEI
jgi:hypothetical protein